MPISAIDGCSEAHWADVQDILVEAIEDAGFEGNLVSNADDVGIIHKRIIQNLYENPLVVCDVSGKNPNVMFELGLRLAFDKPTLIVKDDKTPYSFDTAAIEHIEYPRDLRFSRIVDFKEKLAEKLRATHEKANGDSSFTTFLKHFGDFKVAQIETKEVSAQEFVLEEIRLLRESLDALKRDGRGIRATSTSVADASRLLDFCLRGHDSTEVEAIVSKAIGIPGVAHVNVRQLRGDHAHIRVEPINGMDVFVLKRELRAVIPAPKRVPPTDKAPRKSSSK